MYFHALAISHGSIRNPSGWSRSLSLSPSRSNSHGCSCSCSHNHDPVTVAVTRPFFFFLLHGATSQSCPITLGLEKRNKSGIVLPFFWIGSWSLKCPYIYQVGMYVYVCMHVCIYVYEIQPPYTKNQVAHNVVQMNCFHAGTSLPACQLVTRQSFYETRAKQGPGGMTSMC